jgi:hypothetical protein
LALAVTTGLAVHVVLWPALQTAPASTKWGPVVPAPPSTEDPQPTPPASNVDERQRQQKEAALTAALQRYDESTHVDLALTVVDRNTGRVFSYNGERRFETASIVKVDLLATLLLQAQRSRRSLTPAEKSLATAMIEYSDNAAATTLWNQTGGIARGADVFGLTATAPGAGGRWGGATTTAEDQARLITALASPNGPIRDSRYLFGLMRNVADAQAWGISATAEPGEIVALKNGWMPRSSDDGRWTVNSMGRITDSDTDVTIVVLSRGHASLRAGVDLVEEAARTARVHLGW